MTLTLATSAIFAKARYPGRVLDVREGPWPIRCRRCGTEAEPVLVQVAARRGDLTGRTAGTAAHCGHCLNCLLWQPDTTDQPPL